MSLVNAGPELLAAKERLASYQNNITVFGSARIKDTDPLYQKAYELGKALSDAGYNVFTGAGPGIMEATSKGAYEGKSKSIGLNIDLPREQYTNPYLDEVITFEYFFSRKVMLVKNASACVCFPGGYGTADELMEVLTLLQTQKMKPIPLILYGGIYGIKNIKNILTDKRVNAISIGNTLNYSEHSVQKTKSPLTNNYFRQPCFQKII